MHTAVQLCTALMVVYGVQSVLYCTEILFIRLQMKLVLCEFPKLCTVYTVQCTVANKCALQKYCTQSLRYLYWLVCFAAGR